MKPSWFYRALFLTVLAAHASARTGSIRSNETAQTSKDPYVDTPAYNQFPWIFKADYTFAYVVSPISSAPTPDAAYAGYTQQLSMLGGAQTGLLAVLKYSYTPIGSYSEILYSPGSFATGCSTKGAQHIARIWVDSEISQRAGRNIWGMPKELATFDWSTGPGWVKVSVKDNRSGKLIFEAKMADTPIPQPLMSKVMQLASAVLPGCVPAVQLPIDENTGKTQYANVPAYSVAQKAYNSKPMGRVTTNVCYDPKDGAVVRVLQSFLDPEAWTGRSQEAVSLVPLAVRLPAGATASLTTPVLCQPPAAAAAAAAAAGSASKQQQRTPPAAGGRITALPFLG